MNFYQQTIDRISALPGVKSASAVNFLPLSGWGDFCNFDIAGRPIAPADKPNTAQYRVADWRYLHTMGINVKSGRDFAASDGPDGQGVVILNEALAHRYWQDQNPIGQQIHLNAVHLVDEPRQARIAAQPEDGDLRAQSGNVVEAANRVGDGPWMRGVVEEHLGAVTVEVFEVGRRLTIGHH